MVQSGSAGVRGSSQGLRESVPPVRVQVSSQGLRESEGPVRV